MGAIHDLLNYEKTTGIYIGESFGPLDESQPGIILAMFVNEVVTGGNPNAIFNDVKWQELQIKIILDNGEDVTIEDIYTIKFE